MPNPLPAIDGLLAATASILGLTLVTRNTADVKGTPELQRFRRETAITTYTVCAVRLPLDNYPLLHFGVGEHEVTTLR